MHTPKHTRADTWDEQEGMRTVVVTPGTTTVRVVNAAALAQFLSAAPDRYGFFTFGQAQEEKSGCVPRTGCAKQMSLLTVSSFISIDNCATATGY